MSIQDVARARHILYDMLLHGDLPSNATDGLAKAIKYLSDFLNEQHRAQSVSFGSWYVQYNNGSVNFATEDSAVEWQQTMEYELGTPAHVEKDTQQLVKGL